MPVRMVASQNKIIFFAELCLVCAGWCFLLLFMHFFHSIACFGSVFFGGIKTDQTTQVSTQSTIKYQIKLSNRSQLFDVFIRKGMVTSGINDVRRHQHCCTVYDT